LWKNHPSLLPSPEKKRIKRNEKEILIFGETIVQVGI
jgi:hypothetical protein